MNVSGHAFGNAYIQRHHDSTQYQHVSIKFSNSLWGISSCGALINCSSNLVLCNSKSMDAKSTVICTARLVTAFYFFLKKNYYSAQLPFLSLKTGAGGQ